MLRTLPALAALIAATLPAALLAQEPADGPAAAAAAVSDTAGTLAAEAATLRPGGFRWAPSADVATKAPVRILISVPSQLALVYRGETLIGVSTVSTGKPGHDTPLGSFPILQKAPMHRSNLYDDAPMPFMQRLTWDGVALHAGEIPGHPASHGCVRLPAAFAKQLYAITRLGAVVTITDEAMPMASPAPDAPLPDAAIASGEPVAEPIAQAALPSAPATTGVQLVALPAR
jgi:hypothetical protein